MSKTNYDLIIVGAGPSGIASALEAKRIGLKCLILEKASSHSNMIRTYYKEGKRVDARYAGIDAVCHGVLCLRDGNRESYLEFMDYVIKNNNLEIQYETEVWSIHKDKKAQQFKVKTNKGESRSETIVIAIGKMGRPKQPDYYKEIPFNLKKNKKILFDINSRPLKNECVVVVGGGDSAGEYIDILHKDNNAILSYRRNSIEKMNSVNKAIVEKLSSENKATLMLGSNIQKVEESNNKILITFCEDHFKPLLVDTILYALGGVTPVSFLSNCDIKVNEKGESQVSPYFESSIDGLYIVGDLLGKGKGGGSIISGFNSAHLAICNLGEKYFKLRNIPSEVALDHLKF